MRLRPRDTSFTQVAKEYYDYVSSVSELAWPTSVPWSFPAGHPLDLIRSADLTDELRLSNKIRFAPIVGGNSLEDDGTACLAASALSVPWAELLDKLCDTAVSSDAASLRSALQAIQVITSKKVRKEVDPLLSEPQFLAPDVTVSDGIASSYWPLAAGSSKSAALFESIFVAHAVEGAARVPLLVPLAMPGEGPSDVLLMRSRVSSVILRPPEASRADWPGGLIKQKDRELQQKAVLMAARDLSSIVSPAGLAASVISSSDAADRDPVHVSELEVPALVASTHGPVPLVDLKSWREGGCADGGRSSSDPLASFWVGGQEMYTEQTSLLSSPASLAPRCPSEDLSIGMEDGGQQKQSGLFQSVNLLIAGVAPPRREEAQHIQQQQEEENLPAPAVVASIGITKRSKRADGSLPVQNAEQPADWSFLCGGDELPPSSNASAPSSFQRSKGSPLPLASLLLNDIVSPSAEASGSSASFDSHAVTPISEEWPAGWSEEQSRTPEPDAHECSLSEALRQAAKGSAEVASCTLTPVPAGRASHTAPFISCSGVTQLPTSFRASAFLGLVTPLFSQASDSVDHVVSNASGAAPPLSLASLRQCASELVMLMHDSHAHPISLTGGRRLAGDAAPILSTSASSSESSVEGVPLLFQRSLAGEIAALLGRVLEPSGESSASDGVSMEKREQSSTNVESAEARKGSVLPDASSALATSAQPSVAFNTRNEQTKDPATFSDGSSVQVAGSSPATSGDSSIEAPTENAPVSPPTKRRRLHTTERCDTNEENTTCPTPPSREPANNPSSSEENTTCLTPPSREPANNPSSSANNAAHKSVPQRTGVRFDWRAACGSVMQETLPALETLVSELNLPSLLRAPGTVSSVDADRVKDLVSRLGSLSRGHNDFSPGLSADSLQLRLSDAVALHTVACFASKATDSERLEYVSRLLSKQAYVTKLAVGGRGGLLQHLADTLAGAISRDAPSLPATAIPSRAVTIVDGHACSEGLTPSSFPRGGVPLGSNEGREGVGMTNDVQEGAFLGGSDREDCGSRDSDSSATGPRGWKPSHRFDRSGSPPWHPSGGHDGEDASSSSWNPSDRGALRWAPSPDPSSSSGSDSGRTSSFPWTRNRGDHSGSGSREHDGRSPQHAGAAASPMHSPKDAGPVPLRPSHTAQAVLRGHAVAPVGTVTAATSPSPAEPVGSVSSDCVLRVLVGEGPLQDVPLLRAMEQRVPISLPLPTAPGHCTDDGAGPMHFSFQIVERSLPYPVDVVLGEGLGVCVPDFAHLTGASGQMPLEGSYTSEAKAWVKALAGQVTRYDRLAVLMRVPPGGPDKQALRTLQALVVSCLNFKCTPTQWFFAANAPAAAQVLRDAALSWVLPGLQACAQSDVRVGGASAAAAATAAALARLCRREWLHDEEEPASSWSSAGVALAAAHSDPVAAERFLSAAPCMNPVAAARLVDALQRLGGPLPPIVALARLSEAQLRALARDVGLHEERVMPAWRALRGS